MVANHTPGPWYVSTSFHGHLDIRQESTGLLTSSVPSGADPAHSERQANARLIAAAPELLAACQLAQKRLQDMGMDWLGKGPDPLEVAIAKATGQPTT